MYTTDRLGGLGYTYTDYDSSFGGTSAAAPHVAGIVALMLSVNPHLSVKSVANIIEATAQKVYTSTYGYAQTLGRPNGTWDEVMDWSMPMGQFGGRWIHPRFLPPWSNSHSIPIDLRP